MEDDNSLFNFDEIKIICGTDEAGRGPLAGPVAASAVVLPDDFPFEILNDSKKLSEKELLEREIIIKERALAYSIKFISNEEIDRINILNAALKAMALSFEEVNTLIKVDKLFVDGNKSPRKFINNPNLEIETVIKGDSKIYQIMAASILAKTARDRFMIELDKKYPLYNFKKNKGYGSKEHQEALIKYGPCPYHRKSFKLKKVMLNEESTQSLF